QQDSQDGPHWGATLALAILPWSSAAELGVAVLLWLARRVAIRRLLIALLWAWPLRSRVAGTVARWWALLVLRLIVAILGRLPVLVVRLPCRPVRRVLRGPIARGARCPVREVLSVELPRRVLIRPALWANNARCIIVSVETRSEEHPSELQSRFDLVCRR